MVRLSKHNHLENKKGALFNSGFHCTLTNNQHLPLPHALYFIFSYIVAWWIYFFSCLLTINIFPCLMPCILFFISFLACCPWRTFSYCLCLYAFFLWVGIAQTGTLKHACLYAFFFLSVDCTNRNTKALSLSDTPHPNKHAKFEQGYLYQDEQFDEFQELQQLCDSWDGLQYHLCDRHYHTPPITTKVLCPKQAPSPRLNLHDIAYPRLTTYIIHNH